MNQAVISPTPMRGVVVRNRYARNLLTFLMVFGPGLIVMEADNDAGAVFLCALDLTWLALAFHARPATGEILRNTLVPSIPAGGMTASLVFLVAGIVGTTLAPWQLFFQQGCVADKRLRFADLKWARLDTLFGAALHQGHTFTDPARMAVDLGRVFSPWFRIGILVLMVNAAALGTTAISPSSAWAYGEVRGWPHSLQKSFRDAPGFYAIYVLCVGTAAGLVLIPRAPLQLIIVSVQVLARIILPSAIIFLQLLLNDKELLGERFVNKPWNNAVNWTIIVVLFALSPVLANPSGGAEIIPRRLGKESVMVIENAIEEREFLAIHPLDLAGTFQPHH